MKLDFEYGQGLMSAELPDNTDVFIPGETVKDPECLPQDWDSLYEATLESIRNPMGMPPLRELAAPGKLAVFGVEHRRQAAAGDQDERIFFIQLRRGDGEGGLCRAGL